MDLNDLLDISLAVVRDNKLVNRLADFILGLSEAGRESRLAKVELDNLRRVLSDEVVNPYMFVESATVGNIVLKSRSMLGGTLEGLDDVDFGWWRNWRDKARLAPDQDVETLFAQVLAGQVERPGAFSLQTLSALSNLEKEVADLFTALCRFVVVVNAVRDDTEYNSLVPLFFRRSLSDEVYRPFGYGVGALDCLDSLGLIKNEIDAVVKFIDAQPGDTFHYHDHSFVADSDLSLHGGHVRFTVAGGELYSLCTPEEVPGFWNYVCNRWKQPN